MGLERIRAWTTLFVMAGLRGRPTEILNVGLLRANLCERLCRLCRVGADGHRLHRRPAIRAGRHDVAADG